MDHDNPPSGADPPPDPVANHEQNQIAPRGDLILVVGESRAKLEVDSVILTYASPVFRAMLSGSFAEAVGLQEAKARGERFEIELPEDDSNTIRTIARILHFKNLLNPNVNGKKYLLISIAAHKYDLREALSSFAQSYMFRLMAKFSSYLACPGCLADCSGAALHKALGEQSSSEAHEKDLESRTRTMKEAWSVLLAAFIGRDKSLLTYFSKKLIFGHKGSYHHLIDKEIGYCEVQLHMALEMTARRQLAIEQMITNIPDVQSTLRQKSVHCACGKCSDLETLKTFLLLAHQDLSGVFGSRGYPISGHAFKCDALIVDTPAVAEMYCRFRTGWAILKSDMSRAAPPTCLTLEYVNLLSGSLQHGIHNLSLESFECLGLCLGCFLMRVGEGDEELTRQFHLEECAEDLPEG